MENGIVKAESITTDHESNQLVDNLASQLPQLRTVEDLEVLESQGYDLHSDFGHFSVKRLETQRGRLGFANQALIKAAHQQVRLHDEDTPADASETTRRLEKACIKASRLILDLVLRPPKGVEVCSRNPKQEFPQLARLLLLADLDDTPVPFMVPCCPDTDRYRLGDGLGDVIPKGLNYCDTIRDLFAEYGFCALFDVQVADVEGLDPIVLANSGETTESHFAKTAETIRKAETEVTRRDSEAFIGVRSMQSAFGEVGMSYDTEQLAAIECIDNSQERKIHKTIDGLLTERIRLGNFNRFDEGTRRDLVVAELAGYAAYGAMVGGRAIILSPDAKSAIPAYHYALDKVEQYSPVLYAT